jgi:hypothetical protein
VHHVEKGVAAGIEPLDALEQRAHQLHRRELPLAEKSPGVGYPNPA